MRMSAPITPALRRNLTQDVLDDWVTSLCLYDRKMLAVMFSLTLQKRFKLTATAAALESAWVTGFNEKTVRGYRKVFLAKQWRKRQISSSTMKTFG